MKLLFVCVENSCRSQMAEAFARASGVSGLEVYSAGSRPSGVVNPRAIEFMNELGLDLGTHRSQSVDELAHHAPFDTIVTMGCGDECPHVPTRARIDWDLEDPKHLPPDQFRATRDRIAELVNQLLEIEAEV